MTQVFIDINNEYPHTKLLLVGFFERELDLLLPDTEKEMNNHPNIIPVGYQKDFQNYQIQNDEYIFSLGLPSG